MKRITSLCVGSLFTVLGGLCMAADYPDPISVPAEGVTITVAEGATDNYSGAVTGAGNTLTKEGAGTMNFSSTSDAVWQINAGVVQLAVNAAGTQRFTGPVYINTGATLLSTGNDTWGYGTGTIRNLNIYGGLWNHTGGNETFKDTSFNLKAGTMTKGGTNFWDLYNENVSFTALAADDASAENVTASVVNGAVRFRENTSGAFLMTVEENASLAFNGVISCSKALGITKQGAGTLILNNGGSRITGTTRVEAGTLKLTQNVGNFKLFSGDLYVNSGATLWSNASDSLGYGTTISNVYLTNATFNHTTGNQTLRSINFYLTGSTMNNTASEADTYWDVYNEQVKFYVRAADGATAANPTVSTISGNMRLRDGSLGENPTSAFTTFDVAEGAKLVYSGTMVQSKNFGFTKSGAGVMDITGQTQIHGEINVTGGTLRLGRTSGDTLYWGNGNPVMIRLAPGTTMTAVGGIHHTVTSFTLQSATLTSEGNGNAGYQNKNYNVDGSFSILADVGGVSSKISAVAMEFRGSGGTFDIAEGGTLELSSKIIGVPVTKTGAGLMKFSGTSDCVWNINAGTVQLTNNVGSGKRFSKSLYVNEGATLLSTDADTWGYGTGAHNIYLNGGQWNHTGGNETFVDTGIYLKAGTMTKGGQYYWDLYNQNVTITAQAADDASPDNITASVINGPVRLRASNTGTFQFTVEKNASLEFTGTIVQSANLGITKLGEGTLILSNAGNTFTGAVNVTGGTLVLEGNALPNVSALTIAPGARLETVGEGIKLPATTYAGTMDALQVVVNPGEMASITNYKTANGKVTFGDGARFDLTSNGTVLDWEKFGQPLIFMASTEEFDGIDLVEVNSDDLLLNISDTLYFPLSSVYDAQAGLYYLTSTPGVPEPATWTLLLLGLAGTVFARNSNLIAKRKRLRCWARTLVPPKG